MIAMKMRDGSTIISHTKVRKRYLTTEPTELAEKELLFKGIGETSRSEASARTGIDEDA